MDVLRMIMGRRCPYCEPAHLLQSHSGLWRCPDCETLFDKNLEPIISMENVPPSLSLLPSRRTCQELSQGRLVAEHEILCRQCQHQQTLLVQLLAACEEGVDWHRYREELERRYPLCAPCQRAVQDRLTQIDYRLRIKSLGRSKRDMLLQSNTCDWRSLWFRLAFVLNCLIQAAIVAKQISDITWLKYFVCAASVILSADWRLLPLSFALGAVRVVSLFHEFKHGDVVGVLMLATLQLVYHYLQRPKVVVARPATNPVYPVRPLVSKTEDLLSSLSALSTSSPPSSQHTSMQHRPFTTLIKPEPVKMTPAKFSFNHRSMAQTAPAAKNPFGATTLRPATLPQMQQPSGLEMDLKAFSLSENAASLNSVWQLGLTVTLMVARYFLHAHPSLITLLLAACFCWRGFLWDHIRRHAQLARLLDTIIGARLFWMTLSLINHAQETSAVDRWASFLVDLVIISVR